MNITQLARKLTVGIGSWLQFEYHCHRSELFSEKYLSVPIGQLLNAYYGPHVYAEIRHPVLAPLAKGRGRRPEVDFAVLNPFPKFLIAIESKWASEQTTADSILWDLIRLELIAHASNAQAFFILAGKK